MDLRKLSRFTAVLAGLLVAAVSLAQQAPMKPLAASTGARVLHPSPSTAPNYGTDDLSYVRATGIQFTPYNGGGFAGLGGSLSRYPTTDISMDAAVNVPSGAIIDYLEFDYSDTNVANDMSLTLLDCGPQAAGCNTVPGGVISSSGSAGFGTVSVSGLNYPVVNGTNSIDAEILFFAGDGSLAVTSVIVGYRLQVSPAPGTATFDDVPTDHPFFRWIEALAASGITVGCNAVPPQYCPDRPLTRGEMAVYLSKALGLHFPN